jgi:hypothetical protein
MSAWTDAENAALANRRRAGHVPERKRRQQPAGGVKFRRVSRGLCCTDRLVDVLSPPHGFRLSDADGLRASELKHPV